VAKDFADIYSQYMESPWSFWAFSFLTALGNLLTDRMILRSQIAPQPRLYTIILGESWDVRKSTAIKQTIRFFEKTFPENFYTCNGVGSAEGLSKILKDHPTTLLVYDEFKHFVEKASIRSSVLGVCVNTLHENNEYGDAIRHESISIKDGNLSLLGASTLETFERMWNAHFRAIGFLNRLWLVPDERAAIISLPGLIPFDEYKSLQNEAKSLLPDKKVEIGLEGKAYTIWDEYYKGIRASNSPFVKRLDTYGLRLMVLFCGNEGKNQVDTDMVQRIIRLLEWQLLVRRLTDPIDAESTVAVMEQAIRRTLRKKGELTDRELQKLTNASRTGLWAYTSAKTNLQHSGELRRDKESNTWVLSEDAL
jgi:hypothetical protein